MFSLVRVSPAAVRMGFVRARARERERGITRGARRRAQIRACGGSGVGHNGRRARHRRSAGFGAPFGVPVCGFLSPKISPGLEFFFTKLSISCKEIVLVQYRGCWMEDKCRGRLELEQGWRREPRCGALRRVAGGFPRGDKRRFSCCHDVCRMVSLLEVLPCRDRSRCCRRGPCLRVGTCLCISILLARSGVPGGIERSHEHLLLSVYACIV